MYEMYYIVIFPILFIALYCRFNTKRSSYPDINYGDIIGCEDLKEDIDNHMRTGLGGFFLFQGAPGSGKRTVAKALAGEHQLDFIETSSSKLTDELVEKHPNAIFYYRNKEDMVNKRIVELALEHNVIIIAYSVPNGSNNLKKRYGSYKVVEFKPPSSADRYTFFTRREVNPTSATKLTRYTPKCNYSELEMLMREFILCDADFNNEGDIDLVVNKYFSSMKYTNTRTIRDEEDKKRLAYHEIGHLLTSYLVPGAEKPRMVTILENPRVSFVANMTNLKCTRKSYMIKIMCSYASCVFEEYFFGEYSAGCSADLEDIDAIIRIMNKLEMGYLSAKKKLLDTVREKILDIIENHQELIDKVHKELLIKETLYENEIDSIIGVEYRDSVTVNF